MKKIYILSIVLVSLAACTSKTKKKEDKLKKEVLFGTLNDGLYVNPFFNLSIDFNWWIYTLFENGPAPTPWLPVIMIHGLNFVT